MAHSTLHTITFSSVPFLFKLRRKPYSLSPKPAPPIFNTRLVHNKHPNMQSSRVASVQDAVGGAMAIVQSSPATWQSALLSNLLIFLVGSPILVTGLSLSGIVAAFLLGTLTWRAFGPSGFLLVAAYFIIVNLYFLNFFFCLLLATVVYFECDEFWVKIRFFNEFCEIWEMSVQIIVDFVCVLKMGTGDFP